MASPIGYLVNKTDGLYGARGWAYDFITAANGLFIEAEGELMAARVQVTEADIRGLAPIEPALRLRYGKIPVPLFSLALDLMMMDPSRERYIGVEWRAGQYTLYLPEQKRETARVEFQPGENILLDLHSHGSIAAEFSSIDNHDEQALKLYGVIGRLNAYPQIRLRVGVYGYFMDIKWSDVFEGTLTGVIEAVEKDGNDVV
jgi:PRTRC genetic system protein A